MIPTTIQDFLKEFGNAKPKSKEMKKACKIAEQNLDVSFNDWKVLHTKFKRDKKFREIALKKLKLKAKTFKDWLYIFCSTDWYPDERSEAYTNMFVLATINDWFSFFSKNLGIRNEIEIKKNVLNELNKLDFSDYLCHSIVPREYSISDWFIHYRTHGSNNNFDTIIKKLLECASDCVFEWDALLSLHWQAISANDKKLEELVVEKLKSSKEEQLWTSIYANYEDKEWFKDSTLMQAVLHMECVFGKKYFDKTDDDYTHDPTIDYMGCSIEPEYGDC